MSDKKEKSAWGHSMSLDPSKRASYCIIGFFGSLLSPPVVYMLSSLYKDIPPTALGTKIGCLIGIEIFMAFCVFYPVLFFRGILNSDKLEMTLNKHFRKLAILTALALVVGFLYMVFMIKGQVV